VRCLIWATSPRLNDCLPPSAREVALPHASTDALRAERDAAARSVSDIESRLAKETAFVASLDAARSSVLGDIDYHSVRAGMHEIPLGTGNPIARDSTLCWLTGFVPAAEERRLAALAAQCGWGYLVDDPTGDDAVPTLLKHNRFIGLISPLLDFLGILPGYTEVDISGWFILFFGIFFAMIFGDGGYGLLLVAITAWQMLAARRKGSTVPAALSLILYLSFMTVLWGIATCTWFGLPADTLPGFLRALAIPAFSGTNPEAASNIQVFCFSLGLAQLSIAHLIGVIRNRSSLKLLGDVGALLMLVGMFNVVLNLVVSSSRFPIYPAAVAMIGVGFVLNFAFVNYAGHLGSSVLESFKNFISMFLGVVNVFADIMSYIRLWAVGLAGSAISATVNSMATPLLGGLVMFLAVVLLLFGHGLNLIMNVLSVIVHGVRLNTLEFSNHVGLTWSGFKYEPFSETARQ